MYFPVWWHRIKKQEKQTETDRQTQEKQEEQQKTKTWTKCDICNKLAFLFKAQ